jgi:hypothetical protein
VNSEQKALDEPAGKPEIFSPKIAQLFRSEDLAVFMAGAVYPPPAHIPERCLTTQSQADFVLAEAL